MGIKSNPMSTHLKEYMAGLTEDGLREFLSAADMTLAYANQLRYGYKNIGPAYALQLESASKGQLKAQLLCPDFDWVAAARGRCENCED
jgi:hypothetical protein